MGPLQQMLARTGTRFFRGKPALPHSKSFSLTATVTSVLSLSALSFSCASATPVPPSRSSSAAPLSSSPGVTTIASDCAHTATPLLLATTGPTEVGHCRPTLVLIHGLDSTRFTWNPFIEQSKGRWNVLAVDQRGWGQSPVGEEEQYSFDAVVEDIRHTLAMKNTRGGGKQQPLHSHKVVLLGHSMGGKIAMAFAAKYPEMVAGLIIEDMDIRERKIKPLGESEMRARRAFRNEFPSWPALVSGLGQFYGEQRVAGWKADGRVFEVQQRQEGGHERGQTRWFSGINPLTQWLSLTRVLASVGEKEWKQLTTSPYPFPIRVLVADAKETCCSSDSLAMMSAMHPSRVRVLRFANAAHSIHNTAMPAFIAAVEDLYRELEKRC